VLAVSMFMLLEIQVLSRLGQFLFFTNSRLLCLLVRIGQNGWAIALVEFVSCVST
jgi:hypothetical protein